MVRRRLAAACVLTSSLLGCTDDGAPAAGSLEQAQLTTNGLGPIALGQTFSQIAAADVELDADACDYAINPGGYVNVVLDTIATTDDGERLTGMFFHERANEKIRYQQSTR